MKLARDLALLVPRGTGPGKPPSAVRAHIAVGKRGNNHLHKSVTPFYRKLEPDLLTRLGMSESRVR